jgi:hypothetical protein
MPRTHSKLVEKIRAELARGTETPDQIKCGGVHAAKKTGNKAGNLNRRSGNKFWTFRWEYYRQPFRHYEWCGAKARVISLRERKCSLIRAGVGEGIDEDFLVFL